MRKCLIVIPALLLAAPLAFGTTPVGPAARSRPVLKATPISQAQLKKFVKAYKALVPLRRKYSAEINAAKDIKTRKAIKAKAIRVMKNKVKIIMPITEYEKVGRAIRTEPSLRARFLKMFEIGSRQKPPKG